MKNLRKIIAFFAIIFAVGIYLTVRTVNSSLEQKDSHQTTVEVQKDTTFLLKAEKKTNTV